MSTQVTPLSLLRFPSRLVAVAFAAACLAFVAQAAGRRSEPGFTFTPPVGYRQIPVLLSEEHVAARYVSDATVVEKHESGKWTSTSRARLDVLVFRYGDERTLPATELVYSSYEETRGIGLNHVGCTIAAVRKHADDALTFTDFEGEIATGRGFTRFVAARVVDLGDSSVALSFESAADDAKSLRETANRCFDTFKRGAGRSFAPVPMRPVTFWNNDPAVSEDLRTAKLLEMELDARTWTKTSLPKGWKTVEEQGVLALAADDTKYAREIAQTCAATIDWLDSCFGSFVVHGYARRPIVTLIPDRATWGAITGHDNGGRAPVSSLPFEITTFDDQHAGQGATYDVVAAQVLQGWFVDRDRDLYLALPPWLSIGLGELVRGARVDGTKLACAPDGRENQGIQYAKSRNLIRPLRELLAGPYEIAPKSSYSTLEMSAHQCQPAQLVRLLTNRKDKKHSALFDRYLKNLRDVVDELRPQVEAALVKPERMLTRRYLDSDYGIRANAWYQHAEVIRARTAERTFADWKQADWDSFETAYRKTF